MIGPRDPEQVAAAAAAAPSTATLDALVSGCTACPRLVAWRTSVPDRRRAVWAGQRYWAAGVPGFGPPDARILVVGLAPAAHGANRTGRMFTGDRSGDVLFAALHRAGLASQPDSTDRDDGMQLRDVRMTAPVHCAPPANQPTPAERDACLPYLRRELELVLPAVVVVLGGFGWTALLGSLTALGWQVPRPRPRFGHGAELPLAHPDGRRTTVLGCYHVSQQNTFTGVLTPAMLDGVLARARVLADLP